MSVHVDGSNLREASAKTSEMMFSLDLAERRSGRYEGANGTFARPVPTTSAAVEGMRASLRGSAETPPIAAVSGSQTVGASQLSYGGNTPVGLDAVRSPERGGQAGGKQRQESQRTAEKAQTAKRNPRAAPRPDSEPQPQIYPWMTKLHMNHGKVGLSLLQ